MNKRFLAIAGAVLLLGMISAGALHWYGNIEARLKAPTEQEMYKTAVRIGEVRDRPASPVVPVNPKRVVRLAVGNVGLASAEANARVSDLLLAQLSGATGLEMVDRQSLDKVLRELRLNIGGLVRAGEAVRAGKLLRADWFLLGTPLHVGATSNIMVRIVDARTGIFRETALIPIGAGPASIAIQLAGFIGQCRAKASTSNAPVYLALGALQDLSLNNRLAEFPTQLRSWLTAAYQDSRFTMLERDHVETLLQELRLDLAGLAETSEETASMQTAFWLVEANYQSYNSPEAKVEVDLHISRIFGRSTNILVRATPGDAICQQVKSAVDSVLNAQSRLVVPTRRTEVMVQMSRGQELVARAVPTWHNRELTEQEARLNQRRLEEAIRAFQTALILDPTNRQAKTGLGSCYCDDLIGQFDRGRALLREVIEENFNDTPGQTAALRLRTSFGGAEERRQWFAIAEKQTANTVLQAFYHAQADAALESILRHNGTAEQREALAKKKLLQDISSARNVLRGGSGEVNTDYGLYDYAHFFYPDKTNGAHKIAAILPGLTTVFPDMAPHLVAAALGFQSETNNPVLPEFQRQLERCRLSPGNVLAPVDFWSRARYSAFAWCLDHELYSPATQIMESMREAAHATNSVRFDDEAKMALAFAYKMNEQWAEALAIFESYSNLPVQVGNSGPWGRAFSSIATDKQAAYCLEKLGRTSPRDPGEFDIGPACLSFGSYLTFAVDSNGIWLGYAGNLLHLDLDLKTNLAVRLPTDAVVNCLAVAPSQVWVGTDGGGLLEYDKQSGRLTQFTEEQGLMSDAVATLYLANDTLWIGHGVKNLSVSRELEGGLARLDLATLKFHAFTPSLARSAGVIAEDGSREPMDSAPHRPIRAIAISPQNEVWFSALNSPLRHYQIVSDHWDGLAGMGCHALTADSKRLVAGDHFNYNKPSTPGPLGVSVLSFADQRWTSLGNFSPLPSGMVSALALEGDCLWVGGATYIAKIDLAKNEMRSFCRIPATTVDSLQIGAGYLWAQYDWHIYRFALSRSR
jgi:tetratricopeptide (TPR) repeat protein